MRASRGMGAINPSKMPKGKIIHRKDNPDAVSMYKEVHEKYNPPEKDHKGKAAENKEFEDKRAKSSPLVAKAEIERMKEILDKPRGGGGGGAMPKSNRDITKNYKAGGKVSSASKRADGCAVRGKTKGRIV